MTLAPILFLLLFTVVRGRGILGNSDTRSCINDRQHLGACVRVPLLLPPVGPHVVVVQVVAFTPPRPSKADVKALEVQGVKSLLRHAGTHLYLLWVVLATTALRIGEALRLRWEDVDLDARAVRVNGTLGRDSVSAPRTATSRRMVKLTHAHRQGAQAGQVTTGKLATL